MAATSGFWLTTKKSTPSTAFSASGFSASRVTRTSGGSTYYNYRLSTDITCYSMQNWTTTRPTAASIALPQSMGYQSVYSFSGTAVSGGTIKGYVIPAMRYSISVSAGTGGTASASSSYGYIVMHTTTGDDFSLGSTWTMPVTLTATAQTGYTFGGWYLNGTKVSSSRIYQASEYTGDAVYTALFTASGASVSVVSANPSAGSVSGGGTYTYGQTVTITATPSTGYQFAAWTFNGSTVSTSATYSFTLSSSNSGTYTATFNAQQYQIAADISPSAAGGVMGAGTYNYGDTATLSIMQDATQQVLYPFQYWTKDGVQYSTSRSINITVTGNAAYVAVCASLIYGHYIFQPSNAALGSVSTDGGEYAQGTTVTCTATASSDISSEFVNWTDSGGNVVSSNRTLTFTAVAQVTETYTANFGRPTATVTVTAGTGGTATGGGTARIGSSLTLTATPSSGYVFVRWSDGNASATRTYMVAGTATISAEFALSASPIPPAPSNPQDIYIVRDMRNDGSRIYPHGCDMTFLFKAIADRIQICGGTLTGSVLGLAGTPNVEWHAAADMQVCGQGVKDWIAYGAKTNFCWALPSLTGFPAASGTTWDSTVPSFDQTSVETLLADVASTQNFFVTRTGVAYNSIFDASTGAVVGGPIRENHVRGLYYDLQDRGTNLVFVVGGNSTPVLSFSTSGSGTNYVHSKAWGSTTLDTTTTAASGFGAFNFYRELAVSNDRYEDGTAKVTTWTYGDTWTEGSSGEISLRQAAQGVVTSLKFLTIMVVQRSYHPTAESAYVGEYCVVPYLWSPGNVSSFSAPWRTDPKGVAAGILASLNIPGDAANLAAWAPGAGHHHFYATIQAYYTLCFANLNLDTNVESYGWTAVYPTPSA